MPLTITTKLTDELWPILIEKAYLKLQGGYDFPGSNSGIDIHTLIGWIPEDVRLFGPEFDEDAVWEQLYWGLRQGNALATIATGDVDEIDRDWLALVSSHSYAVLRAITVPNEGKDGGDLRLLRCKNPWSQHQWEGAHGPDEQTLWNDSLRRKVYTLDERIDPEERNGEFYIDWKSVCRYFELLHLSWNPMLFSYQYKIHAAWPMIDFITQSYPCTLAWCPQYNLKVNVSDQENAQIWILLSRHITQPMSAKQEYMTAHVYVTKHGERIFHPVEPTYKVSLARMNTNSILTYD
jgi:calpain-7